MLGHPAAVCGILAKRSQPGSHDHVDFKVLSSYGRSQLPAALVGERLRRLRQRGLAGCPGLVGQRSYARRRELDVSRKSRSCRQLRHPRQERELDRADIRRHGKPWDQSRCRHLHHGILPDRGCNKCVLGHERRDREWRHWRNQFGYVQPCLHRWFDRHQRNLGCWGHHGQLTVTGMCLGRMSCSRWRALFQQRGLRCRNLLQVLCGRRQRSLSGGLRFLGMVQCNNSTGRGIHPCPLRRAVGLL